MQHIMHDLFHHRECLLFLILILFAFGWVMIATDSSPIRFRRSSPVIQAAICSTHPSRPTLHDSSRPVICQGLDYSIKAIKFPIKLETFYHWAFPYLKQFAYWTYSIHQVMSNDFQWYFRYHLVLPLLLRCPLWGLRPAGFWCSADFPVRGA